MTTPTRLTDEQRAELGDAAADMDLGTWHEGRLFTKVERIVTEHVEDAERALVERVAKVLAEHTYVIDGAPSVIGVRCACGFRDSGEFMTPEAADLSARTHVASALAPSSTDNREGEHVPLAVISVDAMPFVRCSCDDQKRPQSAVWLREHWQGDEDSGVAALQAVIQRQKRQADNRFYREPATDDRTDER